MKKVVKGIPIIVLEEYEDGGFVSVPEDRMTTKLEDIYTEEQLIEIADRYPPTIDAFRVMTFQAYLKAWAREDGGWSKHASTLREDGYPID